MSRSAPLGPADRSEVLALLAEHPLDGCFVASRVLGAGLARRRLMADVWGCARAGGRLVGLMYVGANLCPVGGNPQVWSAFARRAVREGRRSTSLVGPAATMDVLWAELEPTWGPAREVRQRQPLMVCEADPHVAPLPGVRRVRPDEVDVLLPAARAMFREEVGVDPDDGDDGGRYRARVEDLVGRGRSFALVEDGRVVFKAELGAVAHDVAQVQGVWVDPARRGEGLGTAGTAAVVAQDPAPRSPRTVSLYVNDFNTAARGRPTRVSASARSGRSAPSCSDAGRDEGGSVAWSTSASGSTW